MVSVIASSAVDCGFEPWSYQIKDCKIGISFFFAKHASKTWWLGIRTMCPSGVTCLPVVYRDYVSEWNDISTCRLLFQWTRTIKIQLSMLDIIIVSSKYNLFSSWFSWKIVHLALNINHSLILFVHQLKGIGGLPQSSNLCLG
jgi:hypothetical protein